MKKFLFLLIAAIIVGFLCLVLLFWIFRMEFEDALIVAICAAITGFIIEYIRPFFGTKKHNGIPERSE